MDSNFKLVPYLFIVIGKINPNIKNLIVPHGFSFANILALADQCQVEASSVRVHHKRCDLTAEAKSLMAHQTSIGQIPTDTTLLAGSKEVHRATSAVPIGQKHKYESSPAASAGTGVGLSISSPEPVLQSISLT